MFEDVHGDAARARNLFVTGLRCPLPPPPLTATRYTETVRIARNPTPKVETLNANLGVTAVCRASFPVLSC